MTPEPKRCTKFGVKGAKRKMPASKTKPVKKRSKFVEVDMEKVEWRAVITVNKANELSDSQRYSIVNWLRAKANELGNDDFGHNLAPTYRMRMIV